MEIVRVTIGLKKIPYTGNVVLVSRCIVQSLSKGFVGGWQSFQFREIALNQQREGLCVLMKVLLLCRNLFQFEYNYKPVQLRLTIHKITFMKPLKSSSTSLVSNSWWCATVFLAVLFQHSHVWKNVYFSNLTALLQLVFNHWKLSGKRVLVIDQGRIEIHHFYPFPFCFSLLTEIVKLLSAIISNKLSYISSQLFVCIWNICAVPILNSSSKLKMQLNRL